MEEESTEPMEIENEIQSNILKTNYFKKRLKLKKDIQKPMSMTKRYFKRL